VLFLGALAIFGGKKESHPSANNPISTVSEEAQGTQASPSVTTPEPTLNDANLSGAALSIASEGKPVVKDSSPAKVASMPEEQVSASVSATSVVVTSDSVGAAGARTVETDAVRALPAVRDREHH
jgi:hypothetical protein